jgi:hypothetical protein
MRLIDRTRTAVFSAARRWAARLPTPMGQRVGPASLALQLTPALPGERPPSAAEEAARPEPRWSMLRQAIVEVVAVEGTLPVHLLTVGRPLDTGALSLIRLAHRLDCPVTVWTDGTGIDNAGAAALLDVGCAAVAVTVASLDDDVQKRVVGNGVAEATDALVALVAARAARSEAVQLHLALPWVAGVESEVRGVMGWAHQVGVDAVMVLPPIRGGSVGPLGEWVEVLRGAGAFGMERPEVRYLDALSQESGDLPGVPRREAHPMARFRPCPVVGTRLALDGQGTLFSCPFHPPMGTVTDSVMAVWETDNTHRQAVRSCTRRCRHPTLDLGPGLPAAWRLKL